LSAGVDLVVLAAAQVGACIGSQAFTQRFDQLATHAVAQVVAGAFQVAGAQA
jgi:hypothetical protein